MQKKKVEEQKKKLEPYMLPYTKMCVEIKHRLKCKSWNQETSMKKKIHFCYPGFVKDFYIGYKKHETF